MRHIIGPIVALFGILILVGLVGGAAYTAGLGAAAVAGGAAAAPAVAYPWYGVPYIGFGFGHFLGFLLILFLVIGLLRLAFGGGHRRHGGWGHGYGYGHRPGDWGPGGWGPGSGPGGTSDSGDPREAWIRGRLDDWHRSAHAAGTAGSTGTTDPTSGPTPESSGPADRPTAS